MDVVTIQAIVSLVVFAALLGLVWALKAKAGKSFTFRVFVALGLGVVFGAVIQALFGRGTDATNLILDWVALVGTGYVNLLKMLVIPLVFISIVGAFTRSKVTENFGKISGVVLATLLVTCAIAAFIGWGSINLFGLAGASFATATADSSAVETLVTKQTTATSITIPQEILSFIPTNIFSDLSQSRSTSVIAVVVFSAFLGVGYLKLRSLGESDEKAAKQARTFADIIDSLYGIIMRVIRLILNLTPYGVLALITKVLATSNYQAILELGKFIIASYVALLLVLLVHSLVLLANKVNPLVYFKKASTVLLFAFVSRTSAGALPLNIETQEKALGVDSASANLAASFGLSIGQNGCAGIYPAMLATIIAPIAGIDPLSPAFLVTLIATVVISSFGVAGVGGGATFASLIVLGTLGLPVEISAILASVEPLIDMGRTAVNVSDAMVAGVTASNVTGGLNREIFNDANALVSGEGAA